MFREKRRSGLELPGKNTVTEPFPLGLAWFANEERGPAPQTKRADNRVEDCRGTRMRRQARAFRARSDRAEETAESRNSPKGAHWQILQPTVATGV